MPAALTTRTLNPLPFEHLEPKRFEDLVRQLLYDFRQWQKLEPTGRLGSDDGFDVRGWELVGDLGRAVSAEDTDDDPIDTPAEERIWLVQCKRERRIGPKKLEEYLAAIDPTIASSLYGVVFAAPCDFSKATRDVQHQWCLKNQVSEWVIWGKAELEDMLFQPKNDHLLFAYFSISLQIRKRSARTEIRAQVAMKRKLKTRLEARGANLPVVLRDPTDERYPYIDRDKPKDQRDHRWRVYRELGLTHRGLKLEVARFFAFVDDDGVHWDWADAYNDAINPHEDPWSDDSDESNTLRHEIWECWHSLPDSNRTFATIVAYLPIDKILDIDELGDDVTEHPQIFALWENARPPLDCCYVECRNLNINTHENRAEKFPARFRRST
jgi:hypothetical protein